MLISSNKKQNTWYKKTKMKQTPKKNIKNVRYENENMRRTCKYRGKTSTPPEYSGVCDTWAGRGRRCTQPSLISLSQIKLKYCTKYFVYFRDRWHRANAYVRCKKQKRERLESTRTTGISLSKVTCLLYRLSYGTDNVLYGKIPVVKKKPRIGIWKLILARNSPHFHEKILGGNGKPKFARKHSGQERGINIFTGWNFFPFPWFPAEFLQRKFFFKKSFEVF